VAVILVCFPVTLWLSANAFVMEYFTVKSQISDIATTKGAQTKFQTESPLRRYLSLSLYGEDDFFTLGTIRNVELAKHIYPGPFLAVGA
jgi:hypothetical protein